MCKHTAEKRHTLLRRDTARDTHVLNSSGFFWLRQVMREMAAVTTPWNTNKKEGRTEKQMLGEETRTLKQTRFIQLAFFTDLHPAQDRFLLLSTDRNVKQQTNGTTTKFLAWSLISFGPCCSCSQSVEICILGDTSSSRTVVNLQRCAPCGTLGCSPCISCCINNVSSL